LSFTVLPYTLRIEINGQIPKPAAVINPTRMRNCSALPVAVTVMSIARLTDAQDGNHDTERKAVDELAKPITNSIGGEKPFHSRF
jgi:hypothetical protein